jgi:xylan 1,4-beta-xylosidase
MTVRFATGRRLGIVSALSLALSASCDAGETTDVTGTGGSSAVVPSGTSGTSPTPAGSGGAGAAGATTAGGATTGGMKGVVSVAGGGGMTGLASGGAGGALFVPTGGSTNTAGMGGAPVPTMPATCKGDFKSVSLEGAPFPITVDAASSKGPLPHFWNTYGIGDMEAFIETDRGWGETLKAHVIDGVQNLGLTSIRAHGLFHDSLGIYREENGTPVYDFTKSDQIFDFLVQNGVEPIVELGSMPAALARDPSLVWFKWQMGTSPPKDYKLWQEMIFKFTEHSVQRYGAEVVSKWLFEVWNEPECCRMQFWDGTLDEYFELYDHAVAGVLRALPNARVGGPVASQPVELTQNSELGTKFLQHITTDNYVNPGSKGQLDVFMYHSWSFIDGAVNGYFQGLDLLGTFGFNDTPIAITEQVYSDIAQRCVRENKRFPLTYAWWTLSDIFREDDYREGEPFIGAMGLISRENLRKPAYNVYKFLAQMGTELVSFTANSPGVGGMAAKDVNGGVQVIVYNGQSPGGGPSDDVYYTPAAAQDVAVTVSGLEADLPYDVEVFRVDETHGNAYSVWETKGRPAMSAMSETDWMDLRGAMDAKAEPMAASECGGTFTGRFSIASPGVVFVKLTPTPPVPVTP